MQTTFALAAALAGVAFATSPTGSAPAGFVTTYPSAFQITAVNTTIVTAKRDVEKRDACPTSDGALIITLKDGVLTDQTGRIADIVANYQFQFDPAPGQADYIYNSGFSVGSNGSLALGSSAVFYRCLSGTFYNLYDRNWAPQCEPILIEVLPCGEGSPGQVTQGTDGQPAATGVATVLPDGQPQVTTVIPITVISDGQPQLPTGVISQLGDGQPQAPTATAAPISVISDGQPQAPTAVPAPISVISDGQPQAPTAVPAPISVISDGQPQAPTAVPAPISVISDGQPQAPTATAAPVPISVISDGQPQAPTATAAPVPISVISDGQPQAPTTMASATVSSNGTIASSTPSQVITNGGNAVAAGSSFMAIVVGLVAALM
ncbi:Cell wall manno CIS3 [Hyphodiscus hymeniophilus]|uniref:Cell wall manno CIS3 n=1 Tax=Hyphodiscus hymeniophilus TaxID=353542 RepID=A0A9P7AYJ9_9HELO|nr:Cell wall manno CIS3 [Hyphodiscus hymeniophilus]